MIQSIKYQLKRKLINSAINGNILAFRLYKTILWFTHNTFKKRKKRGIPKQGHYKDLLVAIKQDFSKRPLISIVLPVYNSSLQFLEEALQSVIHQTYDNWQLCISDDCSPKEEVRMLIKKYADLDNRINFFFRKTNGHISANSNTALELATGDYITFLDHDDVLPLHCLARVVKEINDYPSLDWLYTDEDKINENGLRMLPHRKPSWSPDTLLTRNYITHLMVIKKHLIVEADGFRLGLEGSQDHDLLLRIAEHSKEVRHIPEILYHWRAHSNSVASNLDSKSYAKKATEKAIFEALKRRDIAATIRPYPNLELIYHLDYHINPSISTTLVLFEIGDESKTLKKKSGNNDIFTISAPTELVLTRQINEISRVSDADVLCVAEKNLKYSDSKWLEKLSAQTYQPMTGLLSIQLFQPNGKIYALGNKLKNNKVVRNFENEFDNTGDKHDYFATTTNIDYVNHFFFATKLKTFNKFGLLNKDLGLPEALDQLSLQMEHKHHVLSDAIWGICSKSLYRTQGGK